ncbi:hypothetical protein D3C81_1259660 [compost metagenome]
METSGGEVGVGQVAAAQDQARQVHPGEDGARAARLGLPQPVMLGADQIDLGLGRFLADRVGDVAHDANMAYGH